MNNFLKEFLDTRFKTDQTLFIAIDLLEPLNYSKWNQKYLSFKRFS